MAKYLSQNKESKSEVTFLVLVVFLLLLYFFIPYISNPVIRMWMRSSESFMIATHDKALMSGGDSCIVMFRPPSTKYDTLLLSCPGNVPKSQNLKAEYVRDNITFTVGSVQYVADSSILVNLLSDPRRDVVITSYIDGFSEQFKVVPIGGGVFKLEVPEKMPIQNGAIVRSSKTNMPYGEVYYSVLDKESFIRRVYIRLPFSLDSVKSIALVNYK